MQISNQKGDTTYEHLRKGGGGGAEKSEDATIHQEEDEWWDREARDAVKQICILPRRRRLDARTTNNPIGEVGMGKPISEKRMKSTVVGIINYVQETNNNDYCFNLRRGIG